MRARLALPATPRGSVWSLAAVDDLVGTDFQVTVPGYAPVASVIVEATRQEEAPWMALLVVEAPVFPSPLWVRPSNPRLN